MLSTVHYTLFTLITVYYYIQCTAHKIPNSALNTKYCKLHWTWSTAPCRQWKLYTAHNIWGSGTRPCPHSSKRYSSTQNNCTHTSAHNTTEHNLSTYSTAALSTTGYSTSTHRKICSHPSNCRYPKTQKPTQILQFEQTDSVSRHTQWLKVYWGTLSDWRCIKAHSVTESVLKHTQWLNVYWGTQSNQAWG